MVVDAITIANELLGIFLSNVFAHIFLHAIISRTRVIIACQIVSEQIFEIFTNKYSI